MLDYLHGVLLYGIGNLRGERTLSGLYHLLKGKKSAQTIQDERLFSLEVLFAMFPALHRDELRHHFDDLVVAGYVAGDASSPSLTEKGEQVRRTFFQERPLPLYYKGRQYSTRANVFWRRLVLVIQSLSHLINYHSQFVPVIQDETVFQFVKRFMPSSHSARVELANEVMHELTVLLEPLDEEDAHLFVYRLSGYNRIGFTIDQLADALALDPYEVTVRLQNVTHYLVEHMTPRHILSRLLDKEQQDIPLTASTKKTYKLYEQGLSLEEIASYRHLKQSTIEDHLVELAMLHPKFSIDPFVSKRDQVEIEQVIDRLQTKKLKPIKEHVNEAIDYFQIRLVLVNREGKSC